MNNKTLIECLHFDLDSVLYIPTEFLEATLALTVKVMVHTGLRATTQEALDVLKMIRSRNSNAEDHFNQLCLHFNGVEDAIIIAAGVEKYWDCKIGNMTCAPDTRLILDRLYQKYPLTLISNGRPVKQAGKVYRLGLWHYFSQYDESLKFTRRFFYATHEPQRIKPHSYLWEQARMDIGFTYPRTVMIGDRHWQDIMGAKRLGMITVKINQGLHAAETPETVYEQKLQNGQLESFFDPLLSKDEALKLMQPDYTIQSLKELLPVIQSIETQLA